MIEPRVLKGFRDFLPQAEIIRRDLTEKIEASFRSFGFVPIDTPALEYAEILLGKGGGETEKQIYRFKDNGERDIALRFDLTVPFARFVALHQAELNFPFKRYHIGKVWRGENTQRGRYREFTQCDFDIIGSDSAAADFEILLMIYSTLQKLGVSVNIKINHRGLFNRFLSHIGQEEKSVLVLGCVDKLAKVGIDETEKSLAEITDTINAQKILEFIGAKGKSSICNTDGNTENFEDTLNRITELSGGASPESERLALLRRFMRDATDSGRKKFTTEYTENTEGAGETNKTLCSSDVFTLDPSITRGLDYYTGVVFETFLTDLPEIGSICSGGRYDNLAGLYSKNKISGVGSSIGLDRMISALEELGKLPTATNTAIAIACLKQEDSGLYQALANRFKQAGIYCEVFLDAASSAGNVQADNKHLVKQFVLAEKKGLRWMLIPGNNPLLDPLCLRDLAARQNRNGLSVTEAIQIIGNDVSKLP